jgi:hypothetical protein
MGQTPSGRTTDEEGSPRGPRDVGLEGAQFPLVHPRRLEAELAEPSSQNRGAKVSTLGRISENPAETPRGEAGVCPPQAAFLPPFSLNPLAPPGEGR